MYAKHYKQASEDEKEEVSRASFGRPRLTLIDFREAYD